MDEIPSSVYVIVGTVVVANIGTIGALWLASLKLSWWASDRLAKIDNGISDAKDTAVRAHKRIDKIETDH